MNSRRLRSCSAAAGLLLLLGGAAPVLAAGEGKTGSIDARATKIIDAMGDFLAEQKAFSVKVDIAYDVVQAWGQKLEFGETRLVSVRRPDRIRVDATNRDGSTSGLVFDGNDITVFDTTEKVYGTVSRPGSLVEAIHYFQDDLGMQLPMAAVLMPGLPKLVDEWAHTARYIETATIAGVPCDHVSLSGDWEDVQFWVARGDRPLLQRLVITYTRAEGKPQFQAQLSDWNLSPDLPDSRFTFAPPDGSAKIDFAPLLRKQQPAGARAEGGQP